MYDRFVIKGKFVYNLKSRKYYLILHYRTHSVLFYPLCFTMPHVVFKKEDGNTYFLSSKINLT